MTNRLKGNLLVLGQFVLLGLLIFYPNNPVNTGVFSYALSFISLTSLFIGFLILGFAALALGKSLTAHPIPKKSAELVTDGMYRFVRHPIYTALLLIGLSLAIAGGFFPHFFFYIALVILLIFKARFEERLLAARFAEYASYASKTGRFFPRLIR